MLWLTWLEQSICSFMELIKSLLSLMGEPDYIPLRLPDLQTALNLPAGRQKELESTIEQLISDGFIARIKKNRYCIPRDVNLVTGQIHFRQSGAAMLVIDPHLRQDGKETVQIAAEDTWVAMHRDRVLVRFTEGPSRRRRRGGHPANSAEDTQWGRVIRILSRHRTEVTGSLARSHHFHYVIPDDPRIIQDIYVPDPAKSGLKPVPQTGDKVVAKLLEWKQRHLNPEGELVAVLGKTNEPGAELAAILRKYELAEEFPLQVVEKAAKLPEKVPAKARADRLDLREKLIFTIDPDDSKDFDDALSCEPLPDGNFSVGVHIADVANYVKPGDAFDTEARRRGNSTYLVGKVIPMLPFALSNGLCSLVEGEDRLTKSVIFTLNPQGKILDQAFHQTVIRSSKRLTYKQAMAFIREDDPLAARAVPLPAAHQTGSTGRALTEVPDALMRKLHTAIRQLWDLASQIRRRRMQKGSLDLDMPEVSIYVDETGWADRIEQSFNDASHQLVEEYMLLANEAVGKAMRTTKIPTIYRVHPEPIEEKLNELRDFLAIQGIVVGDLTKREEVTKALQKISAHPQAYTLRIAFLRSLQQARYKAEPEGHYGLNLKNYLHFTSPIRRYADLVAHRSFEVYLTKTPGNGPGQTVKSAVTQKQSDLESLSEVISSSEQNSTEAEREHVKLKLLEFFERECTKKEKTVFGAVITDVRNHGMFVELRVSQAFGLIHVSTLQDDLYQLDAGGTMLVGRRKKKCFHIGQDIEVVTERVDRFKKQIDFRLVSAAIAQPAEGQGLRKPAGDARPNTARPTAPGSTKKFTRKKTTPRNRQGADNRKKNPDTPKKSTKKRRR